MKVKIPKTVKFLTHTYKIRFDSTALNSQGTQGMVRHIYQDIILDKDHTAKSETDQIFLHEYIHIIERHTGMKLDDSDIERITEGLAELLFTSLGIEFDWSLIKEAP